MYEERRCGSWGADGLILELKCMGEFWGADFRARGHTIWGAESLILMNVTHSWKPELETLNSMIIIHLSLETLPPRH